MSSKDSYLILQVHVNYCMRKRVYQMYLLTQWFNAGMMMYVVLKQTVQRHRQGPHRLIRYRCLRTSSGLEASFLHYRASMHPGGKALSLGSLHVRSNLWDWGWNTHALQRSGEIPEVGHSWLWLVDLLADVCSTSKMFPNVEDLPKELRHWTRTKTGCKPCTIRGVDWECVKARNACKEAGTDISPLTSEDTVKRVLEYPELIRTQDWVQLEKVSGIRTNASALQTLLQRCIGAGLQYPHLEACGLPNLRAGLRTRAHGAPTSVYRPPSLEADLGVPLPLPAPQVGPSGSGGMVAASVLALGPLEVPDDVGQLPKRARRHTQTPEGKRQVAAEKKRRQRAQKRGRDLDENNH